MRKILISPGYGAGWSSWNSGPVAKYMLTHQATIDAVESGVGLDDAIKALEVECLAKFGEDYVCVAGAGQLEVVEVDGLVRVDDYDGNESYEVKGEYEGWL